MYAVVGIAFGRLSDRWYRTRLIAAGAAVWRLLTAASGLAQSYTQLFVSRLGVGVGEATCAPAAHSLIGDLYPPHQRARTMGVFMLGLPAGIFLAYMSAGVLGSALAASITEPIRGARDTARAAASYDAVKSPYMAVLRLPTMWWIILSGVFHNFNMYALNAFQAPFLQRFHEMTLKEASNLSAVSVGAVGAIGLLAGGWLADRISVTRRNGRLVVSAWAMAIAAPCIFFALNQPKGATAAFMVLMTLGTMTMYVYYATVYSAIQDVIEPALRGTAVAIYFCAMYILGASMGPLGTGILSDYFAHHAMIIAGAYSMTADFKAAGLHTAMHVIPALAVAASLTLFAASRSVAKDMNRQSPL